MSQQKAKAKYNVNVDTSILDTDISKLELTEHNIDQLFTVWSYLNTTNDHKNFTLTTNKLIQLLKNEEKNKLVPLVKKIMDSNKILYRSLSSMKPSITNPILSLLQEITKYKVHDLFENFDFNLPVIPKLLANDLYRQNFIRFWISLLETSSHLTRKDYLLNYKKLNYAIFKNLEGDHSILLKFLESKVLMEPNYNKQTKAKIFNEFVLSKIILLDEHDFILKVVDNIKYEEKIWSHNTNGVLVLHSDIKIYNKPIFNLISNLKPFENDSHLKLVLDIFKRVPELIPPFNQSFFQIHGANDPKLSSFWIGQTLFLQEIVKLPIPNFNEDDLSVELMLENIIPAPITRQSLTKCFQCESNLIKQLSMNTLLLVFKKLNKILPSLDQDVKLELLNRLKAKLPDLSIMASLPTENPLLTLSTTMIIKNYLQLYPFLSIDFHLNLIKDEPLTGIELVTLENYLDLQENLDDSKWWNSSNNNSFFTNLLKISLKNVSVQSKISNIIAKLLNQTIIFKKSLIPQQFALLQSIKAPLKDEELEKIWKFIDESISRCVRSPYKYLDQSGDLSPMTITLFEQWGFVEKSVNLENWFTLLTRYLVLCGEPLESINALFKKFNYKSTPLMNFQNYEKNYIQNAEINKPLDDSFFEYILSTPLSKIERIPINSVDLAGLVRRIQFIVDDDQLPLKKVEDVLISLMEKLGNFIASTNKFEHWNLLFLTDPENEKSVFASRILNEIFQQLNLIPDNYRETIVSLIKTNDVVISECCWCLSDDDLQKYSNESELMRILILKQFLQRGLKPEYVNFDTENKQELDTINDLYNAKLCDVSEEVIVNLIKKNNRDSYPLIKSICSDHQATIDIEDPKLIVLIGSVSKPSEFFINFIRESIDTFYENFDLDYLKLITNMLDQLPVSDIIEKVLSLNEVLTKSENLFSLELMSLLLCHPFDEKYIALIKPWLMKVLLYINQRLALFDDSLIEFLELFSKFFTRLDIWKFGYKNLNIQLEILLKSDLIKRTMILEYVSQIIKGSHNIEFNKLLQILVNNELLETLEAYDKYRLIAIIDELFYKDVKVNSAKDLQLRFLQLYQCTKSQSDLLIKKMLTDIEASISFNLVNYINSVEFTDFSEPFYHKKTIYINNERLQRSIKQHVRISIRDDPIDKNSDIQNDTYDDEFIMMLIVNEELEFKKLIDTSLLQFIVVNLESPVLYQLLSTIYSKVESNLYKVLIGNILCITKSPLLLSFYLNMIPILSNVSHPLYDKLTKYILSSSRISYEIPMFKLISNPTESDLYYNQVSWFMQTLNSINNIEDLKLLHKLKIIEWVLNLVNNKFMNLNLQAQITSFILKIIKIGGSESLIKSYGLLSWIEMNADRIDKVNYEKLSMSIKIVTNKRSFDWGHNDLDNHIKRVCR